MIDEAGQGGAGWELLLLEAVVQRVFKTSGLHSSIAQERLSQAPLPRQPRQPRPARPLDCAQPTSSSACSEGSIEEKKDVTEDMRSSLAYDCEEDEEECCDEVKDDMMVSVQVSLVAI